MIGDRLHSIGIQSLTIALLALAVLAYLTTVVSGPTASEVAKPMPGSLARPLPAEDRPSTAKIECLPEGPSSNAGDRLYAPRRTPPEVLPEAVPFHGKKGDERYDAIILRAAREYGIDPAVIKAVIMAESGFDPQAVSYAGARGLMQLMPPTAKELKVDDALDPWDNILGGTRYLKQLLGRFGGNLELALAAYNAGSRNVRRYNGIPPFKATQRYIAKIKIYHRYYRRQDFSLASRVMAAIPPELEHLPPLPLAGTITFFSHLYRAVV